ncbi:LANO_0E15280g1_1 [Lachancea nothofagi CBS 11611]|uniref:LANO_0E15280g1_1 n=1 Tax=Lachancea nothofagi CBS 11611 TaxID=1266666 RepID=A0A1G4K0W4_9SACH|nr:LANO_0E15280g1_1 [Lachancea nothofagi CBS 11611]
MYNAMTIKEPIVAQHMGVEVYFAHGLRKIQPYYHSRTSFAKGRWLKRRLLDVLADEFKSHSREEYAKGIERGEFQIIRDDCALSSAHTLVTEIQNKDVIRTTFHKHEPPVRQWSSDERSQSEKTIGGIQIVHECNDLLVINKPSGVPIHPTGQYYQNTLVEVLKMHGKHVFPSHRLDKITSGVLILTKNPHMANKIQQQIRQRNMQKIYLAKVEGCFPKAEALRSFKAFEDPAKITIENSAIYTVELKKQFPAAFSVAREAITKFYPLKYYPASNETLVACQPVTGRTHQIRIHLARMGFPISNDPFYNAKKTKYPKRLRFILDTHNWSDGKLTTGELESHFHDFDRESRLVQRAVDSVDANGNCFECGTTLFPDPDLKDLELCLHAWKYSDSEGHLSFESDMPGWVLEKQEVFEDS